MLGLRRAERHPEHQHILGLSLNQVSLRSRQKRLRVRVPPYDETSHLATPWDCRLELPVAEALLQPGVGGCDASHRHAVGGGADVIQAQRLAEVD